MGLLSRAQEIWGRKTFKEKASFDEPPKVTGLVTHANNAAAVAAGLRVGDLYKTGADPDVICVVH